MGNPLYGKGLRAKLAQPGDEVAPNRSTVILYSTGLLHKSPPSHQKKRSKSLNSLVTWTWWNMDSMSRIIPTGSWRNLRRTLARVFVESGPCRRCLFSDSPLHSAAQSNTARILFGFFGWHHHPMVRNIPSNGFSWMGHWHGTLVLFTFLHILVDRNAYRHPFSITFT